MELVPAAVRPAAEGTSQVILRTRRHVALYDSQQRTIALWPNVDNTARSDERGIISEREPGLSPMGPPRCPTCSRTLNVPGPSTDASPDTRVREDFAWDTDVGGEADRPEIAPNYFRLLAAAPEVSINAVEDTGHFTSQSTGQEHFDSRSAAPGYYERFFVELKLLGRGSRGCVYLCQHVLSGCKLGLYAVKKIPVGDYSDMLLRSLTEVHLMETLNHPNVIPYKHACK